jgi:thiol-disulfide isomerase/thioredoxin
MKSSILIVLCLIVFQASAQNSAILKGHFSFAKEQDIRLMGFVGTKDTLLAQTKTDAVGNFQIAYPKKYTGAATLQVKEMTNLIVLLHNEQFEITWSDYTDFTGVKFTNSKENEAFQQAYTINMDAQKKLAGLTYLLPFYQLDPAKKEWTAQLEKEITSENSRFDAFQKKLPHSSYAKAYLGYRALLQKLQKENKTPEEEKDGEDSFLSVDFSDENIFYSGLTKELFDAYLKQTFTLQEEALIVSKLNFFSDVLKKSSQNNAKALNQYSEYLIHEYEKFGLIACAEHLAISLLDDTKCTINDKTMPILEQYKKMAIGNTAANMVFSTGLKYGKLLEVPAKYKVVIFGASWCEACSIEMPQFKDYAELFKTNYDAEIVFVSLDTDKEKYDAFVKDFPFIHTCDFKGWGSPNVTNYYVFATPSIFILDVENKIVAKPINAIDTAKWLYQNKH